VRNRAIARAGRVGEKVIRAPLRAEELVEIRRLLAGGGALDEPLDLPGVMQLKESSGNASLGKKSTPSVSMLVVRGSPPKSSHWKMSLYMWKRVGGCLSLSHSAKSRTARTSKPDSSLTSLSTDSLGDSPTSTRSPGKVHKPSSFSLTSRIIEGNRTPLTGPSNGTPNHDILGR